MWEYSGNFYDGSFQGPHGYEANNMPTYVYVSLRPRAFFYYDDGDTFLFCHNDAPPSLLGAEFFEWHPQPEIVIVPLDDDPVLTGWMRMLSAVGYDDSPHRTDFLLHNIAWRKGWTELAACLPAIDAEYQEMGRDAHQRSYQALKALDDATRRLDATDTVAWEEARAECIAAMAAIKADREARYSAWFASYRALYGYRR